MRVPFNTIFTAEANGTLTVANSFRVGGVTFQRGVIITSGQIIGSVDFTQYIGHDLEVTNPDGLYIITAIY